MSPQDNMTTVQVFTDYLGKRAEAKNLTATMECLEREIYDARATAAAIVERVGAQLNSANRQLELVQVQTRHLRELLDGQLPEFSPYHNGATSKEPSLSNLSRFDN